MNKHIKIISIAIFVIIFIGLGVYIYHNTKASNKTQTTTSLQEKDLDIVYGLDSAPLTIFMFTSYECQFCRNFFSSAFPLLNEEYITKGKVKLIIKLVNITRNSEVLNSLKLAVSINECGDFKSIDKLLQNEPMVVYSAEFEKLTDDFISENNYISEYMISGKAENYILSNYNDFKKLQLTGTPTFIINNNIYKGYKNYNTLKKKIEKELQAVL